MLRVGKTLLLMLVCTLSMAVKNGPLLQQTTAGLSVEGEADSIAARTWDEETYYRIGILRLQRWVTTNIEALDDPVLAGEISRLLKEADNLAKASDFYMANIWLELIWELVETAEESIASARNGEIKEDASTRNRRRLKWSREVMSGVDLWRQEFSFSFLQQDSTYFDGNGNPFSGVRVNFDYASGSRAALVGSAFLKYSKDYLSGEAGLRYNGSWGKSSRWHLENRFEGISFYGSQTLKYWQNKSTLALVPRLGPVSFEFRDEVNIRRYADDDTTYPDYIHNNAFFSLKLHLGRLSLLDLGYRNDVRFHSGHDLNNYREHRMHLAWTQSLGSVVDFSIEQELRFRDYTKAPVDHFFQDFSEYYLWGNINLAMTEKFGAEVKGALTKRDYRFVTANSLPDLLTWELEPQLYTRPGSHWRLGFGLHYEKENYQELAMRSASVDGASDFGITFADFYAIGPVLTVDFFKVGKLLFSLHESFLFRRYPNAVTENVSDFNLYSDRNTNNILLFVTWDVAKHWQVNFLVNQDDDRSRKDDTGDSHNTLLGAEVSYSF